MKLEPFDKEGIYDDQVAPLMNEIIRVCKAADLQMVASFLYARTEENGESFCTTALTGDSITLAAVRHILKNGVLENQTVSIHPSIPTSFMITTDPERKP